MSVMHGNSVKTLRQDLLAQRKSFAACGDDVPLKTALLSHLQDFLQKNASRLGSIALYWPIQDEVDLRGSLLTWVEEDKARRLCLPFARPDKHLDFYAWQEGDTLIPSQHGVPEPDPNNPRRAQIAPDCILIPCVGWSESMSATRHYFWRLGYGGGYFDRTLAQLRQAKPDLLCVGIGFDWQKLNDAQWQSQTHDEPLDIMLTESGIHNSAR
ncbi:5-formyltetrahydrofolate cyclo-ligase [Polynucleobacter meluiroseus]|uniref:5-formyltetrahydrofolate cyclo-ligase n=1 Tax=Polynucleobacter meluiroseus TaxID=1938814 RepID=A0A240DX39_9BURK|nr:5-formyltetrahydrofolate cyclo-ligase [Polynucleobacter meluiroseus]SNX27755.1 5-formyltetrahydrofolate cyclo-ligase [Polynucleobacter meluiroseus]